MVYNKIFKREKLIFYCFVMVIILDSCQSVCNLSGNKYDLCTDIRDYPWSGLYNYLGICTIVLDSFKIIFHCR